MDSSHPARHSSSLHGRIHEGTIHDSIFFLFPFPSFSSAGDRKDIPRFPLLLPKNQEGFSSKKKRKRKFLNKACCITKQQRNNFPLQDTLPTAWQIIPLHFFKKDLVGTWRDLRRRSDYATFFSLLIREKEEIGAFEKLLPGQEGRERGEIRGCAKGERRRRSFSPFPPALAQRTYYYSGLCGKPW